MNKNLRNFLACITDQGPNTEGVRHLFGFKRRAGVQEANTMVNNFLYLSIYVGRFPQFGG